ncbi:Winged helix-turn-helix DNA-binding protein [uncultured archaeon]|nr:Winged helix-turn-helix DNA-binding protein [uncultured archaeon]
MKATKLFGAMAILCLLVAPAISEPATKGCSCNPGACHKSHEMNCCGRPQEQPFSQICTCPSQISLFCIEVCDTGDYYFGKVSSRSYARQNPSIGSSCSGNSNISPGSCASLTNFNGIGPPDLEVVEYLPPSAKQVFQILASDGPLTQKDLIRRTDLPPRTVRYALSKLKNEDVIAERFCFRDARQSLYSLNGTAPR